MQLSRPHQLARVFHDRRRRRIGIFGGSFNPAHAGHSHIADLAVRHLHLDEIWWLVSPQNPLKPQRGMASFETRIASAMDAANACRFAQRMRVSALEYQLGQQRSADTLIAIRRHAPRASLCWIMGADNLSQFHRWHQPTRIAKAMAIAVINRPGCRPSALSGPGARIAGHRRQPMQLASQLRPGRWCFIHGPLNAQSATAIRANATN